MKFKISILAEVDFTELLSAENVSGAMLALGAKSELDVVKKFAENMLANTQIYTADFTNIYNVTADVSQAEQEQPSQTVQNTQEEEYVESDEPSMSPEEQRALIEKMQQIRHYQELERQAQAEAVAQEQEQEQEQEVVGEYIDVEDVKSPEPELEPEPVDDSYYLPETDVTNYETTNAEVDYSQESNEQVVDTHEENSETIEDEESFQYEEKPQSKLARHLFYLSTMEAEVDSVVVKNQELKDYILNGSTLAIAEDDIIVREDLGQDFVIRYLGEENNMIEVGE